MPLSMNHASATLQIPILNQRMMTKRSTATLLLIGVLLRITTTLSSAQPFHCNTMYRSFTSKHTLCRPPPRDCSVLESGVNSREKKEILKAHNDFRRQLAAGKILGLPSASNMMEMVWDNELAAIAQAHVSQCHFGHDCYACRKVSRFTTGQNLYISWSTNPGAISTNWKSAIASWTNEVKHFNPEEVRVFRGGGEAGHFSQVVWALSEYVGCGRVKYKKQGDTAYRMLYACNYGPTGNIASMAMYEIGKPCSKCPGTCSSSSPGLCSATRKKGAFRKRTPGKLNWKGGVNKKVRRMDVGAQRLKKFQFERPTREVLRYPFPPSHLQMYQESKFPTRSYLIPGYDEQTHQVSNNYQNIPVHGVTSQRFTAGQACVCDPNILAKVRQQLFRLASSFKGPVLDVQVRCNCNHQGAFQGEGRAQGRAGPALVVTPRKLLLEGEMTDLDAEQEERHQEIVTISPRSIYPSGLRHRRQRMEWNQASRRPRALLQMPHEQRYRTPWSYGEQLPFAAHQLQTKYIGLPRTQAPYPQDSQEADFVPDERAEYRAKRR